MAQLFLPNPNNHQRIIFKDGNQHNCILENIQWVSHKEFVYHTLYPGKPFKQKTPKQPKPKREKKKAPPQLLPSIPTEAKPIPGWEQYRITTCGCVYNSKARLLKNVYCGHKRSVRVRLYSKQTKAVRVAVAKLVALTFLPNPYGFTKLIHKDHDLHNTHVSNLLWVNNVDWIRHVRRLQEAADTLGMPLPVKQKPVYSIDPDRVPLTGIPGFYITAAGKVYRENGKEIKPNIRCGLAPIIRIRLNGTTYYFGLATMVAEQFLPNPRHHKRIIFKDRDNRNCKASNLAWVDQQTYMYYCAGRVGGRKIRNERDKAINECTDPWLRNYYETEDIYWLHECWKRIDQSMFFPEWDEVRAEAYLYFVDRVERYSLLHKPGAIIAAHAKGLISKRWQEISPEIPISLLKRTDESLRNRNIGD